ncbi:uncharacterized protein LOC123312045 isoform X3 [Coccinella septempunctata]|uniref:uncharacterized protein LOC123312045 isoform X3 n=1 Tax=Coccinella septempunctata TaxID=41139 RepID=UPI001D07D6B9|nr:uncharacterized protein LOC123312045 isoform X3 [Coccinella septempunctata]
MSGFIGRGLASGLRIFGIQSEADRVCQRCSTIIDGPCMCAPSYPYRRLEVEKHERPVKITFYKSDYSDVGKVVMDVERSMIVHDLCKILAQKMEFTTTAFWSLVEIWVDKKAERVLEEHEKMVDVYKEMLKFKRRATVRYVLRQNVSKFDFLVEPVRCRNEGGIICEDPKFFEDNHLVCYIEKSVDESICPVFFSRALMLNDKGWKLVFILLKDRRLYYTDDRDGETRLMELSEMEIRKHFYPLGPIDLRDIPGLVLIGELSKLQIYRVTKSGNPSVENTATNAFLVRPTATPRVRTTEEDTEEAEHLARIPVLPKGVIRCTSLSPNFATTWIALMRLAKYGKQLRENYRAFKNKNEAPAREFGRANVPNPLLNSPLFRRMGCKAHLGERARKKDQDHLALLDFSGGRDSSGFELTGYGSRKDALVLYSFLALPRSSKHYNRGNTLERFSQSIRRNMERYGDDPKNYPSPSVPLEHQPSTSRDTEEQDSSEIAEKARRFGAIKKIFSSKKNKSGKKKKNAGDKVSPDQVEGEELEMQYKEYVSEEKSVSLFSFVRRRRMLMNFDFVSLSEKRRRCGRSPSSRRTTSRGSCFFTNIGHPL